MQFCSFEKCRYPNFGKDKLTGLPYCRMHQTKRTDFDRRTIIRKAIDKQKSLSTKIRGLQFTPTNLIQLEEKGLIEGEGLALWFKVKMELNEPRCMNCGAYKPELKQWTKGWHSCQAHLLPKRHFRSINTHPLVGLVLGTGFSGLCFCHDIYDGSWDAASKMNIWPEVCRRFLILYPLIKPEEHKYIPKQLLETIKIKTT